MPAFDRVPGLCMMNELKTAEDYGSLPVPGSNHNVVIHEDRADRGAISSGKTKDSCESPDYVWATESSFKATVQSLKVR